RVPAVQFEPGEGDPLLLLGGGQVRLVVRVRQRPAASPCLLQPGQPGADPRGGQVLRLAVVLVPAGELACFGDVEIADGAHPRAGSAWWLRRTGSPRGPGWRCSSTAAMRSTRPSPPGSCSRSSSRT